MTEARLQPALAHQAPSHHDAPAEHHLHGVARSEEPVLDLVDHCHRASSALPHHPKAIHDGVRLERVGSVGCRVPGLVEPHRGEGRTELVQRRAGRRKQCCGGGGQLLVAQLTEGVHLGRALGRRQPGEQEKASALTDEHAICCDPAVGQARLVESGQGVGDVLQHPECGDGVAELRGAAPFVEGGAWQPVGDDVTPLKLPRHDPWKGEGVDALGTLEVLGRSLKGRMAPHQTVGRLLHGSELSAPKLRSARGLYPPCDGATHTLHRRAGDRGLWCVLREMARQEQRPHATLHTACQVDVLVVGAWRGGVGDQAVAAQVLHGSSTEWPFQASRRSRSAAATSSVERPKLRAMASTGSRRT